MSINSSSFNVDGLISGMSTTDIIDKLMTLDRAPLAALQKQKSSVSARDQAYRNIGTKLASFQTAVRALMQTSAINVKSTGSSDSSVATATADSTATNGSFSLGVTQLATQTVARSTAPIAGAIVSSNPLSSAGFATPVNVPAAGTTNSFTVAAAGADGVVRSASVTVNPNDTMDQVLSNMQTALNGLGTGVSFTVGLGTDSAGRANNSVVITPSSSSAKIYFGAGGDTSNFLTATHLAGAVQSTTNGSIASTSPLTGLNLNGAINSSSAGFAGGATVTQAGSFKINGVQIDYSATDSVNTILGRINSSSAGVVAAYDPSKDAITLTNSVSGNALVTIDGTNDTGGLLGALKLTNATQQPGQNAIYTINGQQYSSASNTVSNALPGVTLKLLSAPVGATTTISVSQDTSTAQQNVQKFVDAFNSVVDALSSATAYNATNKTSGPLAGDPTIQSIESSIRELVQNPALGATGKYLTLADIGISTGAWGSAVGTTDNLQLDSTKLSNALSDNPNAVFSVLAGLTTTTTLNSNNFLTTAVGKPTGVYQSGTFQLSYAPPTGGATQGTLTSVFTPSVGVANSPVSQAWTLGTGSTSAIPGMVLNSNTGLNPAQSYSDTLTYTVSNAGVLQGLDQYLSQVLGSNGPIQAEEDNAGTESKDIDDQISSMNTLLDQRRQAYQAQFTALEVALSKLQSQSSQMSSAMAGLGASSR